MQTFSFRLLFVPVAASWLLAASAVHAQVIDADSDTVPDDVDNCLGWWNYDQTDSDGDGLGDACDWCDGDGTDSDWDGLCDGEELCPFDWSPNNENVCDAGPADAGPADAGPADAGPADAGNLDAGPADAGNFDAGPVDAGNFDAGPVDAGNFDAGEPEPEPEPEPDGAGEPQSPACIDDGFTRYPASGTHSPITCGVAERLRSVATENPDLYADVFMKVGDSISYFEDNMGCFVGTQEEPFLLADTGRGHLADTRALFSSRTIEGTTPMDRTSASTRASQVAEWVTSGNPSPLDVEHAVMQAQYAVVMFGANDIARTSDPDLIGDTTDWYAQNMMAIADDLLSRGTIPIFVTLPPLGPSGGPTWMQELAIQFAQITRGIAEMYQVPYVDLQSELFTLPRFGLRPDDVHLNEMRFDRRCNFTDEGLEHGINLRNLRALEALDRAQEVVESPAHWDASGAPPLLGDGSAENPLVVDALPFVASGTTLLANDAIGPGCGSRPDHARDVVFALDLATTTGLRAQLVDHAGSAHDLQMIDDAGNCIDISSTHIQGTFDAGRYTLYASASDLPGDYLLVVQECLDAACAPLPDSCVNNYVDQDETDYDCGGPSCAPCSIGRTCLVDADCESNLCDADRCVAAPTVDAGVVVDAGIEVDGGGAVDAGGFDAGNEDDAGVVDAGSEDDAGVVDAGSEEDAGLVDAGSDEDAGVATCASPPVDSDGDTVCDGIDLCPNAWDYFNQVDSDGDGLGDSCDNCDGPGFDTEWDGVCDAVDNCPATWNPDQADSDNNGIGDACE